MKTWGSGGIALLFLTLALAGGEWLSSCPGCFTPGERAPGTHWIGGWVDPRAGFRRCGEEKNLAKAMEHTVLCSIVDHVEKSLK
jgi:hypothetical protein